MGQKVSLPPLATRTLEIVSQYGVFESELELLWGLFLKKDVNCNDFWTIHECYEIVQEPRSSMVGPFIEALFYMACHADNGQMTFEDFIVSFLSYCSMSKEEILQFMFLVIDKDRNSYVTKTQLREFFMKTAPGKGDTVYLFPANDAASLELYRDGKWDKLIFDELANMAERFPLIGFAPFHLQFLLRSALLGESFWKRWDQDRLRAFYMEGESMAVKEERAIQGQMIQITKPGRFTFKEILEYGRRKSYTHNGKKIARTAELKERGSITEARDESISRTPLLTLIRNPMNAYHVPYVVPVYRAAGSMEQTQFHIETPRSDDEPSIASESD
eukprot:GEMP01047478.1.p1 GENE.GEMP01047478.1~~GEMP01047478.1.p1  ORF type:complete len:331 (+),score=76.63 GEMP01047478.1:31-1023(+)